MPGVEWTTNEGKVLIACAVALALVTGCGAGDGSNTTSSPEANTAPARPEQQGADTPDVEASNCPASLPSCRTAEGRIVYVERVDPDGDGDAHFVIADPQGITLPGLTAIDVRKGLRPRPLPAVGVLISAAGPVQTGSLGQSQIHAIELHVASDGGGFPAGRRG
jgi:hypothetical protein